MRVKTYRGGGVLAAGLLAAILALGADQAWAQSNASNGRLPQANARQKEPTSGTAAHSVGARKENMQRQKAVRSGTSDNGPPKTVP
jgi:hypothetical protein